MAVVACQPALVLWPRTIQNGAVGSWTTTVADVVPEWVTVTEGAGPDCAAATRPDARAGRAAPPGAESSTRLSTSTSTPGGNPGWVCTTWGPGPRVIPGAAEPHPLTWSVPRAAADAVVPVMRRGTARPSMVSRSLRHGAGSWPGPGPARGMPGTSISATPMGRATWLSA